LKRNWIRPLFFLAGIYDAVLGIAFLFFSPAIFRVAGVTLPNHMAYIEFPAPVLLIFAALFFQLPHDPVRNRDLLPYGAALKVAYAGVVFWNAVSGGIPGLWIPWAWIDLVFLVLFLVAWNSLRAPTS
jgi:hypothetical protein